MPSKHSKNAGDQHHFSYAEKKMCGYGTESQRLGTESQTPFGYCCLSLNPVHDAVVSPSGHLYSREAILEYLLLKTKGIKQQQQQYEHQLSRNREEENKKQLDEKDRQISNFTDSQDVGSIAKRKSSEIESQQSYMESRKKVIDDTDPLLKKEQLRKISPWIVDFTPTAKDAEIKEPVKRPSSPFSGRPLRVKDLIPVNLVRERSEDKGAAGLVRFICPVSRYF
jgi:nitric oxide synthase-interacting protein